MFKALEIARTAQSPTLAPTGLFIKYLYPIDVSPLRKLSIKKSPIAIKQ